MYSSGFFSRGKLMRTAMGGYPICLVYLIVKKTDKTRELPMIHVHSDFLTPHPIIKGLPVYPGI